MYQKRLFRYISLTLVLSLSLMCSAFASPSNFGFGINSGQNANSNAGFNQNSGNSGLGKAGNYVVNQGIMKGDGNNNYNMSGYIKRGDMAVMIVRAFNLDTDASGNFSDVSSGSYYYDAIATIKSIGIAKGDGRNFSPEKNMTLEEAITFVERAAELSAGSKTLPGGVDLRGLYSGQTLSNYATREDVAALLYYILTGDTTGESSGNYSGIIDAIAYSTDGGEELTFDEDDFIDAFEDATGDDLYYVKFTLPSTSSGKLYYDYSSSSSYDSLVTASTRYYVDSSPYLYDVTFVPKSGYAGTVSISYTAYSEDGDSSTGVVKITVSESEVSIGTIAYSTEEGEALVFDEDDFIDAFEDATGDDLYYVKFTLPSTSSGKLYYDYSSSSDYDSLIKASTRYYVDESPYLSDITFVPKSGYTGTVSISYTAYNEDGDSSAGVVKITVSESEVSIGTIAYSTDEGEALTFDEGDFIDAFEDATGDDLYYVKFTLPSASSGKLYYDYSSSSDYDSLVKASTRYYADGSPYLSDVTFAPKSGYTGTVSISYTAYDDDGDSYTGTVRIIVEDD